MNHCPEHVEKDIPKETPSDAVHDRANQPCFGDWLRTLPLSTPTRS